MTARYALLPLASTLHHRSDAGALGSAALGESVLERQLRLLRASGHDRIVALLPEGASRPPALLVGPDLVVATSGREAAARLADVDHVLMLGHGVVADRSVLDGLRRHDAAVATRPPAAGWERIDGDEHWAGVLILPGASARAVLEGLGDWDAQATLLRRAVQDGVPRLAIPPDKVAHGFAEGGLIRLLQERAHRRLARDDGMTSVPAQVLLRRAARSVADALARPVPVSDAAVVLPAVAALAAGASGRPVLAGLLMLGTVLAGGAASAVRRLADRPIRRVLLGVSAVVALVPLLCAVASSQAVLLPVLLWAGGLLGVLGLVTRRGLPAVLRLDALAGLFTVLSALCDPVVALAGIALAVAACRVSRRPVRARLRRLWADGRA